MISQVVLLSHINAVPPFSREDPWAIDWDPSEPVPGCEECLEYLRQNPPPAQPESHFTRSVRIAQFWVPLLKRLGFSRSAIGIWVIWYKAEVCSWDHLIDFLLWHIETGLVPIPTES